MLKDACTVTADPGGNTWFNLSGNPGMATAGSGDVLSGILSGVFCMYLTQDMNTEKSCGTAELLACLFMEEQEIWLQKKRASME